MLLCNIIVFGCVCMCEFVSFLGLCDIVFDARILFMVALG